MLAFEILKHYVCKPLSSSISSTRTQLGEIATSIDMNPWDLPSSEAKHEEARSSDLMGLMKRLTTLASANAEYKANLSYACRLLKAIYSLRQDIDKATDATVLPEELAARHNLPARLECLQAELEALEDVIVAQKADVQCLIQSVSLQSVLSACSLPDSDVEVGLCADCGSRQSFNIQDRGVLSTYGRRLEEGRDPNPTGQH